MSGLARVVLFGAALAAIAAGAAAVGRAIGPLEREVAADAHVDSEAEPHAAPQPVGLAVAANGFQLLPRGMIYRRGRNTLRFEILGARGYEIVHERRMHLIVVRRDLTQFQHLHPTFRDGVWTTPITFAEPGSYRVFADFSSGGKRTVLAHDLFVPGAWRHHVVRPDPRAPVVDGYVVHRRPAENLEFEVTRNGRVIQPEPYLGALGHLVVLRVGDLAYVHTHPESDALAFEAHLPTRGLYRGFLQFKHGGRVHTAPFTIENVGV